MEYCELKRLLIVADDFTGSLDTGIQLAKRGIPVQVVTDWTYDFAKSDPEIPVIVVDTESRPVSKEEAYRRVYEVTRRAKESGIQYFYKKTDSALRGNVGSELLGMMDGCGEKVLMMAPAFPKIRRLTQDGVHYIDGVPVADSVFGKDPFEPVKYSKVEDILRSQAEITVENISESARMSVKLHSEEKKILVFDVSSEESLEELSGLLKKEDAYHLCSGCAGLAAYYPAMLTLGENEENKLLEKNKLPETNKFLKTNKLLCLCGSVNPITVQQMTYAKNHGFTEENLPCYKKLDPEYYRSEVGQKELDALYERVQASNRYLIDTLDVPGEETVAAYAAVHGLSDKEIRVRITETLGYIGWELIKRGYDGAISATGGDTLMGFMKESGCKELIPLVEIGQGAVLSDACWDGKKVPVISKSGGFGAEDIFVEMFEKLSQGE